LFKVRLLLFLKFEQGNKKDTRISGTNYMYVAAQLNYYATLEHALGDKTKNNYYLGNPVCHVQTT
jgi:hypothetical protein